MNSAASLKAFCGRNGGIVCTSSNAGKVYDWAFERGTKLLFFPDQHLGRNTGVKKGIPLDEMAVWDYTKPFGRSAGTQSRSCERARVILWKGHLLGAPALFGRADREGARGAPGDQGDRAPGVHDGGRAGGGHGRLDGGASRGRSRRRRRARSGRSGRRSTSSRGWRGRTRTRRCSAWTRWCARARRCTASTPAYLAWALDELVEGEVLNRITVPQDVADPARLALERMLAAKPPAASAAAWEHAS